MDRLRELITAMVEARKNVLIQFELITIHKEKLNAAKAAYALADQEYFLKRREYETELKRRQNA